MLNSIKKILNRMVFIERENKKYFELGEFINLAASQIPFKRLNKIVNDFNKWDYMELKLADASITSELLKQKYSKKVNLWEQKFTDNRTFFPVNIIFQLIDFFYLYQNTNKYFNSKLGVVLEQKESFSESKIYTKITASEHWFHTRKQKKLADLINQFTSGLNFHSSFVQIERLNHNDRCMISIRFDIVKYNQEEQKTLRALLEKSNLGEKIEFRKNEHHTVYGHAKDCFFKIVDSRIIAYKKNSLFSESIFLNRLKNIRGFPIVKEYKRINNHEILLMNNIKGKALNEYLQDNNSNIENALLFKLFDQVRKLRINHISHRDLKSSNIIITSNNEVFIIDFDQAIFDMDLYSKVDFAKTKFSKSSPMVTLNWTLYKTATIRKKIQEIKNSLNKVWQEAAKSDSNSPGREIAYYSYDFADSDFPGERDFFERYLLFEKNNISFKNKTVVELGSNLGLFGSYCALYGAKSVLCFDIDEKIITCAKKFSKIIGLSNIKHEVRDLNVKGAFKDIKQTDLILALSVLFWLDDSTEFNRLLILAKEVIYEGHEQYNVEIERLKNWGFSEIRPIGMTSRFRTIFYGKK